MLTAREESVTYLLAYNGMLLYMWDINFDGIKDTVNG